MFFPLPPRVVLSGLGDRLPLMNDTEHSASWFFQERDILVIEGAVSGLESVGQRSIFMLYSQSERAGRLARSVVDVLRWSTVH